MHIRSATSRPRPRSRVRRGARERGAQRVLIYNNLVGSVFMTFMSTTNNSTPGKHVVLGAAVADAAGRGGSGHRDGGTGVSQIARAHG